MGNNADKNWMVVKQKDGFEQLIFMGDVLPYRFAFNDKIKKITINTYATQIGQYAFYGCPELEEIIVNVETLDINKYAFAYCPKLKHVTFNYERKFDKFLSVNERAFLGCGIMEFRFSDETTYIDATKIKRNETYSDLHIQAVTKILQTMAESPDETTYTIELEDDYIKWSDCIEIRPVGGGKFYLTDGGFAESTIDDKENLKIGWVKDYIDSTCEDKNFFFKNGQFRSLCKDIDEAADTLIEMCGAVKYVGGLAYYLQQIGSATEISAEEINEGVRTVLKTYRSLSKKQVEDIFDDLIMKTVRDDQDIRNWIKMIYIRAQVHNMTEEQFKHMKENL